MAPPPRKRLNGYMQLCWQIWFKKKKSLWKTNIYGKCHRCVGRISMSWFPIEKELLFRRRYGLGCWSGPSRCLNILRMRSSLVEISGCEFLVGKWISGEDDMNIATKHILLVFYVCVCLMTFWYLFFWYDSELHINNCNVFVVDSSKSLLG